MSKSKDHAIVIDPAFEALLPKLADEELATLEANILRDKGCDALTAWRETNILLDGHHRHRICIANDIAYEVKYLSFESRDDAMDWMDAYQLGRRNLTGDGASLARGRRAIRMTKAPHRPKGGQNNTLNSPSKTSGKLAAEHKVSESTIKRDKTFAEAVETLKPIAPKLEQDIVSGHGPSKKAVAAAAKVAETAPEQAKQILAGTNGKHTPPAPKAGKPVYDDRPFEDLYGKLIRFIDRRKQALGYTANHKIKEHDECIAAMGTLLNAWTRWQRAST